MAQIRADLLPRIAALLPEAREAHERSTTRLPQRPSRATGVRKPAGPLQRVDLLAIGHIALERERASSQLEDLRDSRFGIDHALRPRRLGEHAVRGGVVDAGQVTETEAPERCCWSGSRDRLEHAKNDWCAGGVG